MGRKGLLCDGFSFWSLLCAFLLGTERKWMGQRKGRAPNQRKRKRTCQCGIQRQDRDCLPRPVLPCAVTKRYMWMWWGRAWSNMSASATWCASMAIRTQGYIQVVISSKIIVYISFFYIKNCLGLFGRNLDSSRNFSDTDSLQKCLFVEIESLGWNRLAIDPYSL